MDENGTNTSTIFDFCLRTRSSDRFDILECVSDGLESIENSSAQEDIKSYMLLLSSALVFFMQCGFASVCAGAVRKKNVQNTMLKNLLDACGTTVAFYFFGYAFAFGEHHYVTRKSVIGHSNFFSVGGVDMAFWLFQCTISAACVTIVAGTIAERCQMAAYLLYSMVLAGFVYPVIAHAVWSRQGILSPFSEDPFMGIGMIDFAGAGVVHLTGGTTALYAAIILGSRRGRFYDVHTGEELETPASFKGHSISLQVFGTFLLWFGWLGFNAGSALLLEHDKFVIEIAELTTVNTCLTAAAACVTALLVQMLIDERRLGQYTLNLVSAMNGCLAGLVASTAGCATMENWAALITGFVAGIVYSLGSILLIKQKIDDVVDAIPVHMFNSIWGILATGLFSSPGLVFKAYGTDKHPGLLYYLAIIGNNKHDEQDDISASLMACQIMGVVFILGWTFVTMVPFFLLLNYMGWLRTESVAEIVGMDMLYHGNTMGKDLEDEDDRIVDEYLDAFADYKESIIKKRALNNSWQVGSAGSSLPVSLESDYSQSISTKRDHADMSYHSQKSKKSFTSQKSQVSQCTHKSKSSLSSKRSNTSCHSRASSHHSSTLSKALQDSMLISDGL